MTATDASPPPSTSSTSTSTSTSTSSPSGAKLPQRRKKDLRPDELAALEEQRDFLLRSLDDLEREHAAGDVDEHDYVSLRDDYTARAATVIRAIERHGERQRRRAPRRTGKPWWQRVVALGGVAAFALGAGLLVAQAAGRREAGDTATGDIRETTRDRLDQAVVLASQGRYDEAIDLQDQVLEDQPEHVEAMSYKGWFQMLSGDVGDGMLTLIDAVEIDPEFPDAHAFLAIGFSRVGRPDAALEELDRLDELDPPPEIAQLTDQLRTQLESGGDDAGG